MTQNDTTIDRRSLLKKVAVAGATTGLAAGSAGATAADRPGRSADPAEAEQLLESYGGDLLALLSEEGVLDAGDAAELATDRPASPYAPLRGEAGTAFVDSGVSPARLVTVTEVAGGTLTASVEPETGESYALLDDGESVTVFNPEVGTLDADDTATTQSCSQYACPPEADGSCYASSAVTYEGDRVATQASCCSYYQCTDP
ncbi:hypothetical protein M0R89_18860 (plasmid) [Halorussus limi]|uniref:Twin-arginine translocation signal domain-containing protein n=1 Tax=Halorussus limi TaxID=2938695 RepID=A0A8U0HZQ8_9EURY|nr:hypothetical protein [Halorussus limi]UPV76595.1 hypothetical protein M0R89_18860 [Halorussus limi]